MSTPKRPLAKCPKCKGTGVAQIAITLAITYARFANGSRLSALMVHQQGAEGKTVNGVYCRLNMLFNLGLLEKEKEGRVWYYFRPAKKD